MELSKLTDDELFGRIEAMANTERVTLVDFIAHLGELDARPACQRRGYSSVFSYLTRGLGFAESDAMRRLRTARAAHKFRSILGMLARGELHLAGVSMLEPVLTSENHQALLRKACRKSTREIEAIVARLLPAAPEPIDRLRALPPPAAPEKMAAQPEPALLSTLEPEAPPEPAPTRHVFTFAAGEDVRGWFEQARDLLRHTYPKGSMEEIIGEALRRLVERERSGRPGRKLPKNTRRIAKWIQDEVWRRDNGRCAYTSEEQRCGETAWLEYDHIMPWSLGGRSDDPANIRLLCRAHNQAEARRLLTGS